MNGISRINDQNLKAQLAAQFNDFYLQTTSSSINQIGNYKVIEEIGEGAFGKVYLANHILLNVNVVLKCGLIDDPNIVREIYYHRQLKHKNIVKLYEIIKTENHLWLALEYCQGNELFYYIYEQRHLNIDTVKKLFIQILNGIKYVHSLNLSHRDLKLENILLADKQKTIVKLTDFGFVREFNPLKRQFLSTICGTTVYMAPELLKNEKYSGFSIDIWSLGIILFTMLYGEMPFDEDDDLKTKYKIIHDDPVYKEIIPPDAINLLKKILCKDPYKRPTLNEIINHPFLSVTQPIEKSRRSSLYNDSESIISINQYYNTNKIPFQSKIERHLLKKLEKLNINIDFLQQSVLNDETNSITAFYDLCLTQEFNKKKKRYLKEKKLRYYEAKKSLKKSRKKVKSALSLNDQNNNQPLERIISSLSLTSTKNHDQNTPSSNMISSPQSIDDQMKLKEKRRRSASASIINSNSFANYQNKDLKSENNPPQINIEPSNERVISFHQDDDEKRRPSNVTALSSIVSENKKKRTKNNNILNKLQFWKRNRRNTIHNFDDDITPDLNDTINDNDLMVNTNTNNTSALEFQSNSSDSPKIQSPPNLESYYISSGNRQMRTRPSSVVSQASQISQFSQLSTMLSESELDILDETDTMDEEFDDDEAAYESSLNISQNDFAQHQRQLSASMTPTSSMNITNNNKANIKKRPSYNRQLSSDISIVSTSTTATGQLQNGKSNLHSKKISLSQVSSNSSEESLI
ncbi:Pkinase-domain-containing protein, partial [Hyphopichia burtonii NRRL Y-1933]